MSEITIRIPITSPGEEVTSVKTVCPHGEVEHAVLRSAIEAPDKKTLYLAPMRQIAARHRACFRCDCVATGYES